MAELNLFPDERVVFQAAIYLVGLASAHYFFIRPLVALGRERSSRTVGASAVAESALSRVDGLEGDYASRVGAATEAARELRQLELLAGQADAESLLRSAHNESKAQVDRVRAEVDAQVQVQRSQLSQRAKVLAGELMTKLGAGLLIPLAIAIGGAPDQVGMAAGGGGPVEFWSGIFWPYFQFAVFALGFWYFGRGALNKMLERKRDVLRTQLSEAKQAANVANARVQEYELKVASLEANLAKLREQYAAEGAKQRESLIEEANRVRTQILHDTEKRTDELVLSARETLRRDLVDEAFAILDKELHGKVLESLNSRLRTKALELAKQTH
jgi:F-type H+-transporting ATPase subunit b